MTLEKEKLQLELPRSIETAIYIFTVNSPNTAVYGPKEYVNRQYLPVILGIVIPHRLWDRISTVYGPYRFTWVFDACL